MSAVQVTIAPRQCPATLLQSAPRGRQSLNAPRVRGSFGGKPVRLSGVPVTYPSLGGWFSRFFNPEKDSKQPSSQGTPQGKPSHEPFPERSKQQEGKDRRYDQPEFQAKKNESESPGREGLNVEAKKEEDKAKEDDEAKVEGSGKRWDLSADAKRSDKGEQKPARAKQGQLGKERGEEGAPDMGGKAQELGGRVMQNVQGAAGRMEGKVEQGVNQGMGQVADFDLQLPGQRTENVGMDALADVQKIQGQRKEEDKEYGPRRAKEPTARPVAEGSVRQQEATGDGMQVLKDKLREGEQEEARQLESLGKEGDALERRREEQRRPVEAARTQKRAPEADAPESGLVVLEYETGWNKAFIHFSADDMPWTPLPGKEMETTEVEDPEGGGARKVYKRAIIPAKHHVEFVLNDGRGKWDHPRDRQNYWLEVETEKSKKYIIHEGEVSPLE
eukprot:jgi/Mesvir1/2623/Mv16237-RA.1